MIRHLHILPLLLACLLAGCPGQQDGPTIVASPDIKPGEPPMVDAGPDQRVDEEATITLRGAALPAPGRSLRRAGWSQRVDQSPRADLPADSAQEQISIKVPQVEEDSLLTFVFSAEDDLGREARDEVVVLVRNTLPNRLPIAVTNGNLTVAHEVREIELDGCRSTDPDGVIVSHRWQEVTPGHGRVLSGEGCRVRADLGRADATDVDYRFTLVVTDDQGATDDASLTVTQRRADSNSSPTLDHASAAPVPARPGEIVSLSAMASDPDGDAIRYSWQQTSGSKVRLIDADRPQARFIAPDQAVVLEFVITASDGRAGVSQPVAVRIAPRDAYAAPTPGECLMAPTRFGCLEALKLLLPENPVTPALGLHAITDTAGACNPDGRADWPHHWGVVHDHTAYSDGHALTRPADVFARTRDKGWQFAFTTDHSDNLGLPAPITAADDPAFCTTRPEACVLSDPDRPADSLDKWQATLRQAVQATTSRFTALRGFEWTSDRFGHANVLLSSSFINPKTGPGYVGTMSSFWQWFVTSEALGGGRDGLMVFNHPGREDALHGPLTSVKTAPGSPSTLPGSDQLPANPVSDALAAEGDPAYAFNDFAYVPAADYRVVGVEVFGKGDEYDSKGRRRSWFAHALGKGWFLAPFGSEDHHDTRWGDDDLPKTVIIARTGAREDIREAMLARRVYAVAQGHTSLRVNYTALSAGRIWPMGSRLSMPDGQVKLQVDVRARDGYAMPLPPDAVRIELYTSRQPASEDVRPAVTINADQATLTLDNVDTRFSWAFVRVVDRRNGRIVAVTAPIWFKSATAPLPVCNASR